MSSRDLHRLREASPEPARSDGNSSIRVDDAPSNRASSTNPQPVSESPEQSLSTSALSGVPAPGTSLRTRSSIEHDLLGLDLLVCAHGVKRPRPELSDDEGSDNEPAPKRDKLLEELCSLQSMGNTANDLGGKEEREYQEEIPVQPRRIHPPQDRLLPVRRHRDLRSAPSLEEYKQHADQLNLTGARGTEKKREVASADDIHHPPNHDI